LSLADQGLWIILGFAHLIAPFLVRALVGATMDHRREEWRANVAIRARHLAEERKERLDATKQFYASPEWKLVRDQVIREQGRVCSECGKRVRNSSDVTVDHIRPRSKYPDLALDRQNLRVLCRRCNSSKGAKDCPGE